jgi:hypothetical protein
VRAELVEVSHNLPDSLLFLGDCFFRRWWHQLPEPFNESPTLFASDLNQPTPLKPCQLPIEPAFKGWTSLAANAHASFAWLLANDAQNRQPLPSLHEQLVCQIWATKHFARKELGQVFNACDIATPYAENDLLWQILS